jgi:hypothetical protein
MAVKIDKNELNEPDKLQLFFISLRAFVEKYRTRIYAATGGLLLIFILACGWYLYQQNYESNADKNFFRVNPQVMGSPLPVTRRSSTSIRAATPLLLPVTNWRICTWVANSSI